MRHVRMWAAMLLAMVMLAACADVPTASDGGGISASTITGPSGDVLLDPVIVIGQPSECDPWMDLNWCKEPGQCMTGTPGEPTDPELTTTVNSCPPGSGGGTAGPGGDGGSGGTGGIGGSTGTDPSKQLEEDAAAACPPCNDRPPTVAEAQTMESLLVDVQCTDGRSTLSQMLRDGSLRVYTEGNTHYGVWNSNTRQIYINWAKHVDSTGALDTHELADTMVHEAVHKLLGHLNGQPHTEVHGEEFRNKMATCGFTQG
jgi:hypothetical protein